MSTGELRTGENMDDITKRELEELRKRLERIEQTQALQEKYLERIGDEMAFGAGHFAKGSELVRELRAEIKKIK